MINWIDVNDRVPKLLQKVLFHWVCPGGNRNISMGYLCNEGWDIYLPYHSYKMHPKRLHVTHWAELPNFPEYKLERFVGEIIIDDPLCPEFDEVGIDEGNDDKTVAQVFIGGYPLVAESVKKGTENAKKFAEKFVENNKELLKRLADL